MDHAWSGRRRKGLELARRIGMLRAQSRQHRPREETALKVTASSLRKGNIVEMDGKLYIILSAENIHPGKGTPVTQLNMRRISDGVKISERYRTTETVERAIVDDRTYTFLYQDGEGFHFMNPETFDQVVASEDVVGESAPYLTDGVQVT